MCVGAERRARLGHPLRVGLADLLVSPIMELSSDIIGGTPTFAHSRPGEAANAGDR